jgi:solute:Na+ symporter, SSS family
VPSQFAIHLQLLGGIWIIQTLPSVRLGAYTRWVQRLGAARRLGSWHRRRYRNGFHDELHADYRLALSGVTFPCYTALYAAIVNITLATVLHAMSGDLSP